MTSTRLAALLLAQLDAYLTAHRHVRFLLLQYPPHQLSLVLAMQALVGKDVFQVAGIMAVDDDHPLPTAVVMRKPEGVEQVTTTTDGSTTTTTMTTTAASGRGQGETGRGRGNSPFDDDDDDAQHPHKVRRNSDSSSASSPPPLHPSDSDSETSSEDDDTPAHHAALFAKTNFILTSQASDSEIAGFISTVWRMLIAISDFYIPEHVPQKVSIQPANFRGPVNGGGGGGQEIGRQNSRRDKAAVLLAANDEQQPHQHHHHQRHHHQQQQQQQQFQQPSPPRHALTPPSHLLPQRNASTRSQRSRFQNQYQYQQNHQQGQNHQPLASPPVSSPPDFTNHPPLPQPLSSHGVYQAVVRHEMAGGIVGGESASSSAAVLKPQIQLQQHQQPAPPRHEQPHQPQQQQQHQATPFFPPPLPPIPTESDKSYDVFDNNNTFTHQNRRPTSPIPSISSPPSSRSAHSGATRRTTGHSFAAARRRLASLRAAHRALAGDTESLYRGGGLAGMRRYSSSVGQLAAQGDVPPQSILAPEHNNNKQVILHPGGDKKEGADAFDVHEKGEEDGDEWVDEHEGEYDDDDDEDDDEVDKDARRLMPMWERRRNAQQKASSRKALKWLGLA